MAKGNVLIVDDHIQLADNLAEIMSGWGFEAVIAASAEEGLEIITARAIDALVTDFRLPGLNGAQLIAEVRRQGNPMPAVVISAHTDADTIGASRAAGAMKVLGKPVPLDELMSTMVGLAASAPQAVRARGDR